MRYPMWYQWGKTFSFFFFHIKGKFNTFTCACTCTWLVDGVGKTINTYKRSTLMVWFCQLIHTHDWLFYFTWYALAIFFKEFNSRFQAKSAIQWLNTCALTMTPALKSLVSTTRSTTAGTTRTKVHAGRSHLGHFRCLFSTILHWDGWLGFCGKELGAEVLALAIDKSLCKPWRQRWGLSLGCELLTPSGCSANNPVCPGCGNALVEFCSPGC